MDLYVLHNQFIALVDKEGIVKFNPISITWSKENELYELKVDVVNKSVRYDIPESTGFSRISED